MKEIFMDKDKNLGFYGMNLDRQFYGLPPYYTEEEAEP
jgi:hypothetical protein